MRTPEESTPPHTFYGSAEKRASFLRRLQDLYPDVDGPAEALLLEAQFHLARQSADPSAQEELQRLDLISGAEYGVAIQAVASPLLPHSSTSETDAQVGIQIIESIRSMRSMGLVDAEKQIAPLLSNAAAHGIEVIEQAMKAIRRVGEIRETQYDRSPLGQMQKAYRQAIARKKVELAARSLNLVPASHERSIRNLLRVCETDPALLEEETSRRRDEAIRAATNMTRASEKWDARDRRHQEAAKQMLLAIHLCNVPDAIAEARAEEEALRLLKLAQAETQDVRQIAEAFFKTTQRAVGGADDHQHSAQAQSRTPLAITAQQARILRTLDGLIGDAREQSIESMQQTEDPGSSPPQHNR